jgi:hypothetical protein
MSDITTFNLLPVNSVENCHIATFANLSEDLWCEKKKKD